MDDDQSPSPAPPADSSRNPVSMLRIAGLLVIGGLLGTLIGGAIIYRMPKIYAALARIEGTEHSGHAKEITRLRAEMALRTGTFEKRWAPSFDAAAEKIQKAVRLKPDKDGVTIEVRSTDPADARHVARELALYLDTPVREKEMAAKGLHVGPQSREDSSKGADIINLQDLLEEQAVAAGFKGTWGQLLLGPGEDPVLTGLAKDEDFARRFAMVKQLIVEAGCYAPPGETLRPPNEHAKLGDFPTMPVSPNVVLWMNGFRLLGLLLAGLLILALLRWKPAMLRPERRVPAPALPQQRVAVENKDPW